MVRLAVPTAAMHCNAALALVACVDGGHDVVVLPTKIVGIVVVCVLAAGAVVVYKRRTRVQPTGEGSDSLLQTEHLRWEAGMARRELFGKSATATFSTENPAAHDWTAAGMAADAGIAAGGMWR